MNKAADILLKSVNNRKNKVDRNLKSLLESIGKDRLDDCCLEGKL